MSLVTSTRSQSSASRLIVVVSVGAIDNLSRERAALDRLVEGIRAPGWLTERDTSTVTWRWHSGHLEAVVVTAELCEAQPERVRGQIAGAWPVGSGWLALACEMTDPDHPRVWAAAESFLCGLEPALARLA